MNIQSTITRERKTLWPSCGMNRSQNQSVSPPSAPAVQTTVIDHDTMLTIGLMIMVCSR
ncbi:hypothetical protein [Leifsonia poae]|uniref:hypothetical protein n=1 Tax=Leifsonia poae TaxID=110933 RepID=UPI0021DAF97F|nr:hypothetical protein [Leifsonia poae]